ncbi:type I-G CRISPR-associated protein, Cas3-extension family [Marinactinospora thermotolerans]|uniref:type I-G CRISPR-associated protein, Cas3-extension family n=1 Tax=Marinactinospora thermotolerans TaxID=531310 RepID=UPI003D94DFED
MTTPTFPSPGSGVALPALSGLQPFGFLAALGVLAILEHAHDTGRLAGPAPCLAFTHDNGHIGPGGHWVAGGTARIHHPQLTSVEQIAELLVDVARGMHAAEQVVPGVAGFPPEGTREALRVPPEEFPELARRVSEQHGPAGLKWLHRLVSPHIIDAKGRCALSPYIATRGRQTTRSFFAFSRDMVVEEPDYLHQALTLWRRVEGCTGENLDYAAERNAGQTPDGVPSNQGVPGATWLATQALRFTGLGVDQEGYLSATLWYQQWETRRPDPQPVMAWPLWWLPLPPRVVESLLNTKLPGLRYRSGALTLPARIPVWQPPLPPLFSVFYRQRVAEFEEELVSKGEIEEGEGVPEEMLKDIKWEVSELLEEKYTGPGELVGAVIVGRDWLSRLGFERNGGPYLDFYASYDLQLNGLITIAAAERRPASKHAGPLVPLPECWLI